MQGAGFHNLGQLTAQADQLFINRAAVCLNLGFAGTAHKPQTTPLAFQVCPSADQTRPLIAQRCHFHLQHTFAGGGTVGKDFQNQSSAVQNFDAPILFQIALLHRGQWTVDHHQFDVVGFEHLPQFINLARAKQPPRLGFGQGNNGLTNHLKAGQRFGQ